MSIPCKLDRGPSISPVKPLEVREDLGLPFASDPSTPKLTTLDDPPPVDDTRFSWIGLPADVHLLHNPLPTMVMTPAATAKRKQPALHKIEPKVNPADNPPTLSNRESSPSSRAPQPRRKSPTRTVSTQTQGSPSSSQASRSSCSRAFARAPTSTASLTTPSSEARASRASHPPSRLVTRGPCMPSALQPKNA